MTSISGDRAATKPQIFRSNKYNIFQRKMASFMMQLTGGRELVNEQKAEV